MEKQLNSLIPSELVERVESNMNAVIVQFIPDECGHKRFVSLVIKDQEMIGVLTEEAKRILNMG